MGLHDNEVHEVLVFCNDLENTQKTQLQILDKNHLLKSNEKYNEMNIIDHIQRFLLKIQIDYIYLQFYQICFCKHFLM